jgi:hypothetical protein
MDLADQTDVESIRPPNQSIHLPDAFGLPRKKVFALGRNCSSYRWWRSAMAEPWHQRVAQFRNKSPGTTVADHFIGVASTSNLSAYAGSDIALDSRSFRGYIHA